MINHYWKKILVLFVVAIVITLFFIFLQAENTNNSVIQNNHESQKADNESYKDGQVTDSLAIQGWKTYHSASKKFQISFPADYVIEEQLSAVRFRHPQGWDEVVITPSCSEKLDTDGFFKLTNTQTVFKKYPAKVYESIVEKSAKIIRIANGNGCYTLGSYVHYTPKKLEALDPILNTFDYDKQQADLSFEKDTDKWLTFKNDELGISFKYPAKYRADKDVLFAKGDTGEIFFGILRNAKCLNTSKTCTESLLRFGGSTLNYRAAKEASGYESGGYEKTGSRYYLNSLSGKIEIPKDYMVTEIKAIDTTGIMTSGMDISDPGPGWSPPTMRRATFNLKSSRFVGINFVNDNIDIISEEEFVSILKTITVY